MSRYFDLHVTTRHSFGKETVDALARMAERLELDTICIADAMDGAEDLALIKKEISSVKCNVKILLGIEIKAKTVSDLANKVNKFRDSADIIIVSGGDLDINRAACENPKVDILAHPEYMRKDSGLDHVMVAAAAKNNVAIELNFRSYLHSFGRIRSHILSRMQRNVILCRKFKAPLIVTSGAQTIHDMRAGRELATLAYLCGMEITEALECVSTTPEFLVNRVNEIKSKGFVMPGVRVVG